MSREARLLVSSEQDPTHQLIDVATRSAGERLHVNGIRHQATLIGVYHAQMVGMR